MQHPFGQDFQETIPQAILFVSSDGYEQITVYKQLKVIILRTELHVNIYES